MIPASHSTHTARWLHGTYRQLRSRSMHTTQRSSSAMASSMAACCCCAVARSSVSSCLTWTKAVRWATRCWRKVEEEEEEDEGASEVTESDDDGGASKKGNETNDGDQGKDSGPKESAAIGEAAGTGAPKTRKSVNKDKVDEAEEEEAADASDSEEDS